MEAARRGLKQHQEFKTAAFNFQPTVWKKASKQTWKPPPTGMSKINTDAAVFGDGTVGFGFVIRNAEGLVEMAGSKRTPVQGDSTFVEALAMRFAL
ncbi:hypothetical protein ACS0TY_021343 [Phlomoides rotata]